MGISGPRGVSGHPCRPPPRWRQSSAWLLEPRELSSCRQGRTRCSCHVLALARVAGPSPPWPRVSVPPDPQGNRAAAQSPEPACSGGKVSGVWVCPPEMCLLRAQVPSTDDPEVAGLALLAALTFAGKLGGTMGPPCAGVQELLFQSSLFKDPPVGVSSSPSAGSSSALPTPLKAAGGIPSPSPAAERGWGGPALPSPGLWEQSEGDTSISFSTE